MTSIREKRMQSWKIESDKAFREMAESIKRENGGPVYFELVNNGAYNIRKQ